MNYRFKNKATNTIVTINDVALAEIKNGIVLSEEYGCYAETDIAYIKFIRRDGTTAVYKLKNVGNLEVSDGGEFSGGR